MLIDRLALAIYLNYNVNINNKKTMININMNILEEEQPDIHLNLCNNPTLAYRNKSMNSLQIILITVIRSLEVLQLML